MRDRMVEVERQVEYEAEKFGAVASRRYQEGTTGS